MLALLLACEAPPAPVVTGACADASARVGDTVCVEEIADRPAWEQVAVDAGVAGQELTLKFLVPVGDSEPVPPAFVNSQRYVLHYDFLREAFAGDYADLTSAEYADMVLDPEERAYFAGDVAEHDGEGFAFFVWDDPADASTMPTLDEVTTVWETLQARFGLATLSFYPMSENQRRAAEGWDAPFEVLDGGGLTYEAYHQGVAYGTLRFVALAELEAASLAGSFGWQDILVLDESPMDVARVVSGAVTGTRQAALSHLNVRLSSRGTPNCFVAEPWTQLAAWEGRLVRFECGEKSWTVAEADAAEAEAWWAELRPDAVDIPDADLDYAEMPGLRDVPTASEADRDVAVARFGAKGANLATLYARIDVDYQLDGFVLPFAFYDRFMRAHGFDVQLAAMHADEAFLSDAAVRSARLAELRAAMLAAEVDATDLAAIAERIDAIFGDREMVRFRSSSNAEDGVEFSGAGLYLSASACLADDRDAEAVGPSRCGDKDDERPVADALRTVWASLWLAGAWEERAWYGIDQGAVAMAVLVNEQSEDEQANIVAFTGNPLSESPGWLVESQLGDLDVVSAESGITPERVLLTTALGNVTGIRRVATSSEAEEVLTDAQLREVGALLLQVEEVMPRDVAGDWIWDTEQKVLEDGRLVIKQVRGWE